MIAFDDDGRPRCTEAVARLSLSCSLRPHFAAIFVAAALAGCGLTSAPGSFMADPGRYSVLHCKDLVDEWTRLTGRELELRKLQDRASEGTGGALIGSISYRAEYETVLSNEKMVKSAALEKNCPLTPTYQSDQTIR